MNIVERVKSILLKPGDTWVVIKNEETSIKHLYTSYSVILAAIPPIASLIGMSMVGFSVIGFRYRVPFGSAFVSALFHYIFSLLGLYIVAVITNALAPNFGSRKNILNAFKVVVFSNTPAWIASILLIIPSLSSLVMILSLYSLYLFYTGLPFLMETPRDKTLGYTILVIIISIVVFFLIGTISNAMLPSRIPFPQQSI
jgi:hypothetical protein